MRDRIQRLADFERVAGMIVTRRGVGKGASRAIASAALLPSQ
jgi:hypothetical protein